MGKAYPVDIAFEDDSQPAIIAVSFDPGVTTGWAIHRTPMEEAIREGFSEAVFSPAFGWCSGQFEAKDEDDICDSMIALTRTAYSMGDYIGREGFGGDVFVIAMEDFVLQKLQMDRSLLSPVRIFSKYEYAMKKLSQASGVVLPYFKASAADAKRVVSDERLARWSLLKPGIQHARDAQRHGILITRKYISSPIVRESVNRSRKSGAPPSA